ncbi:butanoate--CoA ligase AAE1-like [Silene latifolia]|uniref:butanoate--CoA ligase AAE1-like n=1 Tax=Silene latifolia TaxID=37657 RepID=UPI003D77A628
MEGLVRCSANYVPLSPISFLERAALVYRDRLSVIYGNVHYTWGQTLERCTQLASALSLLGISSGDVVAAFIPNIPAMYELHFAVPMAGGVLCTLNIRHDAAMVSVLLKHSNAKLIFVDAQFFEVVQKAIGIMSKATSNLPRIILVIDKQSVGVGYSMPSSVSLEYESLLQTGKSDFEIQKPKDELQPISLNYTSGTTSTPKGVIYSHRGAYLNSLATVMLMEMGSTTVYLWTNPMFHCNGWCLTWGLAARGGTNICLRNVTANGIFSNIAEHKVTHMGGAPTVLSMMINARDEQKKPLPAKVAVMIGAAPPPPQVLFKMEEMGFVAIHAYGLTETYGPGTFCALKPEWNALPPHEQAKMKARQGVHHIGMEEVDVKHPVTMESAPSDGRTMGEVMFRGNTVMNGYLNDLKATQEAFQGGWFHTGDLGVKHPDGYIELKDRAKDIIISGGENISTIEVESVIFNHPAVVDAAVVGRPDDHWGETVCAFIELKSGHSHVSAEDMITFCRDHLPRYMVPRTVVFEKLPKTSTGKTQKFVLKEKAKAMGSLSRSNASKL